MAPGEEEEERRRARRPGGGRAARPRRRAGDGATWHRRERGCRGVARLRDEGAGAEAAVAWLRVVTGAAATMALFQEEEDVAAAATAAWFREDHFFQAFLEHRGMDPYVRLRVLPPPVGMARETRPVRWRRCSPAPRYPRRGQFVALQNWRGARTFPLLAGPAARGVLPPLHLSGGAAAVNPRPQRSYVTVVNGANALALLQETLDPKTIVTYTSDLSTTRPRLWLFCMVRWYLATGTTSSRTDDEVISVIKFSPIVGVLMLVVIMVDSRVKVLHSFSQFIYVALANKNSTSLKCQQNGIDLLKNCTQRINCQGKDNVLTKHSCRNILFAQNCCSLHELASISNSCETWRSMLLLMDAMVPYMARYQMEVHMKDLNSLCAVRAIILCSPLAIVKLISEAPDKNSTRVTYQPNGSECRSLMFLCFIRKENANEMGVIKQ